MPIGHLHENPFGLSKHKCEQPPFLFPHRFTANLRSL